MFTHQYLRAVQYSFFNNAADQLILQKCKRHKVRERQLVKQTVDTQPNKYEYKEVTHTGLHNL